MIGEKNISEAEPMMKIACPHCQVLGEIPTIVLQNSNWPIACHHCHQHYFAPVVSGPEKLARQKKITCSGCTAKAEIDMDKFAAVIACESELYCPSCHDLLPLPKNTARKKTSAMLLQNPITDETNEAKTASSSATTPPANTLPATTRPHILPGWRSALFLVFAGFVLTALAMMAAREGLIDRVWLDKLLLGLPDKQALTTTLNALLG